MKNLKALLSLLIAVFFLSGCAASTKLPRFVWPPPPEKPRVEWKGVYFTEADYSRNEGGDFFNKFLGDTEGDRFKTPIGIAADSKNRVYISDVHQKNVWVYDFANKKVGFISSLSPFASPLGVAIDGQDNVYVADGEKGKVFVFSSAGEPLNTIDGSGLMEKPAYLEINEQLGRLYVSDAKLHKVLAFDLSGNHLFSFGEKGSEEGQFFAPQGMAFSPEGDLFVVDMLNARVQVFSADGKFKYLFGTRGDKAGQFESPKDIAFDSDGNAYVVEGRRSNVEIYSSDGQLLLVLGDGRVTRSVFGFAAPRAIHIDKTDRIYVSNALGRSFSVWNYFGLKYQAENPFTDEDKRVLLEYMKHVQEEKK